MNRLIDADALIEDIDGDLTDSIAEGRAIEKIMNAPIINPEPQWIPCSERLPKQGQEVICQCRANIIMILKLDADGDWFQDVDHCYMSGFVIAWMPLPSAYREEGDA